MKINKNFILLCEKVIRDITGRLSFINVYEVLYAEKVPAMIGEMVVIAEFYAEKLKKKQDIKFMLSLLSPSEELVFKKEIKKELKADKSKKQKLGFILNLNGIKLEEFGEYELNFFIDDEQVGEKKFKVVERKKT